MLHNSCARIGDVCLFPLGRLGDETVYRYRWEVTAFVKDGVVVRRRHDGIERTLSASWIERYSLEDRPRQRTDDRRIIARETARTRRLQEARQQLQGDPNALGYYVSARKGPQFVALLGPFIDHYTALQLVRDAWPIVNEYADPFLEVSVGTCRTATSERQGKFNARVLGT